MEMATKGEILPENLPPTERAAVQHSLRVHQQTVVWESLDEVQPNPLDWGWRQEGTSYHPVMTDIEIAPAELLKVTQITSQNRINIVW